jgi:hypothetical protein
MLLLIIVYADVELGRVLRTAARVTASRARHDARRLRQATSRRPSSSGGARESGYRSCTVWPGE